jgi:hypothetical protein
MNTKGASIEAPFVFVVAMPQCRDAGNVGGRQAPGHSAGNWPHQVACGLRTVA